MLSFFQTFAVFQVIKPSGLLLFRDYGLYDHAMIRFGPGQKLGESFYFRHDGTYTYFFATGTTDTDRCVVETEQNTSWYFQKRFEEYSQKQALWWCLVTTFSEKRPTRRRTFVCLEYLFKRSSASRRYERMRCLVLRHRHKL